MVTESEKTVYFAGELFSLKHLMGNASLAEAIHQESSGEYRSILPQDLEQRETTPQAIRDQDIRTLLHCDLGLFHFDGDEVDSGTVVEYMLAKFADIPAVIIRTDFRGKGDNNELPWNLMLGNFPRTEVLLFDAMAEYQRFLPKDSNELKYSFIAAREAHQEIAKKVIAAFRRVQTAAPILPPGLRDQVYHWLRLMPGEVFSQKFSEKEITQLLQEKLKNGLLR